MANGLHLPLRVLLKPMKTAGGRRRGTLTIPLCFSMLKYTDTMLDASLWRSVFGKEHFLNSFCRLSAVCRHRAKNSWKLQVLCFSEDPRLIARRQFCTGEFRRSGQPIGYKNCTFHRYPFRPRKFLPFKLNSLRIIKDFMIQGGAFLFLAIPSFFFKLPLVVLRRFSQRKHSCFHTHTLFHFIICAVRRNWESVNLRG